MTQEKKQKKFLTEEQAKKYLRPVKKGASPTLTDRIWEHHPKTSKQQAPGANPARFVDKK